jgi:hypothetical protein
VTEIAEDVVLAIVDLHAAGPVASKFSRKFACFTSGSWQL